MTTSLLAAIQIFGHGKLFTKKAFSSSFFCNFSTKMASTFNKTGEESAMSIEARSINEVSDSALFNTCLKTITEEEESCTNYIESDILYVDPQRRRCNRCLLPHAIFNSRVSLICEDCKHTPKTFVDGRQHMRQHLHGSAVFIKKKSTSIKGIWWI